jgi:FtsP/CotA-like multicopper oxidase with cupredoxin domain
MGAMGAMEPQPYNGHTIHMHGADVITAEDGVPETGAAVMGDTYTFSPTANMAGSMMYHCHVHTVKHLEMGMYGALVVRPKNASGAFLNQITPSAATAYDYVQTYLFSTVDPAYHTATGDSTVFADYNPKYYLISGAEGKTTAAPAISLAAAVNKKVALRLVGIHSVNGTFSIKDSSGNAKPFTVYTRDARSLATPQTVTSLDISPGQRADIIFTTPSTTGTWYPQMAYKKLRDNALFATAYGKVTF